METFRRGAVSLPASVADSPLLRDVLSGRDRAVLERFELAMLGDTADMMEIQDHAESGAPYLDAAFRSDPALYA